jgi:hypothetical protein
MLKIIKGIFGVDPTDLLPGVRDTGSFSRNPLEGGMMPDLTAKMMIGEGGLRNLEEAGMPQRLSTDDLAMAQFDLESLGKDGLEGKTDWLKRGVEIDPLADKVMYEIPDDEVRLLKGRKLENLEGEYGFSELFKADLLTNAYPDIEDLKIKIINEPKSSSAGGFDPVENILVLNKGHDYVKQDFKKTLLHEVQHFVQEKENFTRGENFKLRLSEEEDYVAGVTAMEKAIGSKYVVDSLAKLLVDSEGSNLKAGSVQKAMTDLVNNPGMDTKKVLEKSFQSKEMAQKFLSRMKQYPALVGFLDSKELADMGYVQAFNKYQRVAGEQFANATAARGNMTADEIYFPPNAYRYDLLDPNNMLPSSIAQQLQGKQNFANPMESSIKSSIPEGL